MLSLIKGFCRNERGASAVEYAMLVVFIALAIAAGAQTFGAGLNTWFNNTAASLAGLQSQIPGSGTNTTQ